jgi:radical SAM superfamily enzyme YgiQ (UPF0313 family)
MKPIKIKRYGSGKRFPRIYLIAPRHPENVWSLQGTVEVIGAKTLMPNAALATLMSLTPPDVSVEYVLCDENISEIDWDTPCDLVAVTGSTIHAHRITEICNGFRSKGKPVALGGSYASIYKEECAGLADHLFIGEAEYTWPMFLREWSNGKAQRLYVQKSHIDLKDSPAPDWSLIQAKDYVNLTVQTSRGCPHNCDFCDVVQYLGRDYRTKSVAQILGEVKAAHSIGAHSVFFSDDNFLGNKWFTRELLHGLIQWNTMQARPLTFSTQITVHVADDEALLKMFADARFSVLFLGVETVRKESLEEIHKTQNISHDLRERIMRISRYGIVPFLGLIVGFDHDDISVFDELYQFVEDTSSPIACISLLNAPKNTVLFDRLKLDNRLVGDDFSGEWQLYTNIVPKQMSRKDLQQNYWRLFQKIYEPERFDERLKKWLAQVEYRSPLYVNKKSDMKQLAMMGTMLKYFVFSSDPNVRKLFFRNVGHSLKKYPKLMRRTITLLAQFRHFYDFVHHDLPVH